MRNIFFIFMVLLIGKFASAASPIKYVGCSPENNASISSANEFYLNFDFSNVIATYGENASWGVGCSGFYSDTSTTPEQSARLYKGTPDDGELLGRMSVSIKPANDLFQSGTKFLISFPDVFIEPGQKYTLIVTYNFYAGIKGESKWKTDTKLSFVSDPLILTFYGASQTVKVLSCETNSLGENATLKALNENVKLTFNHDVEVLSDAAVAVSVSENGITMVTASSMTVDPNDSKSVLISFPETPLYNGHKYSLNVPAGVIGVAGETDVTNSEICIPFEGASFRSFGIGRVYPANNSTAIIDNINVPFKFPTIEGSEWSYGFVNVQGAKYPMRLYKGTEEDGELVATINGEPNNSSLDFALTCDLEPGTQYTCVIDEGTVKAYAIGDPRQSYLKDYISEKVVLTYTTPALDQLGSMTIGCKDINDNDAVEHLGAVAFTCSGYEYNGTTYGISEVDNDTRNLPGYVYEVTADGENEICRFRFSKIALDDLVAQINTDLYEGKTYRVVIPAKTFKVNNSNFLGRYVFNEELSLTLTGKKSTESTGEFTSGMVEGQNLSHVGVVSFYTAGDVKAIDNARLELRKGEETVASAPVRVVKEEGYTHIYADFSGEGHKPFATEKGVNYAAVLPQGTVAEVANENLLNKEYSVPFTGMAPEAVYHNVTLSLDNAAAQTSAVEEGKTVSFQLTPVDDLWKVESVENATLDEASGMYVTEPVNADLEVKATFALVNPVDFNFTTGVGEVPAGCAYSVRSEGEMLIIEGVTAGDNIHIYTTGGTLIADKTVPADMSVAAMNLASGIYIVAINNTTLKIRH